MPIPTTTTAHTQDHDRTHPEHAPRRPSASALLVRCGSPTTAWAILHLQLLWLLLLLIVFRPPGWPRYFILYHHGGLYADLDMEAVRPIEPLLRKHDHDFGVVLGSEPYDHGAIPPPASAAAALPLPSIIF